MGGDAEEPLSGVDPGILGSVPLDGEWPFALRAGSADPVLRRPVSFDARVWNQYMNNPSRLIVCNDERNSLE